MALRADLARSVPAAGGLAGSGWSPDVFSAGDVGHLQVPPRSKSPCHARWLSAPGAAQFDFGDGRATFAAAELGREFSDATGESAG